MIRTVLTSLLLLTLLADCSAFDSSAPSISRQQLLQQINAKAEMLILDVRTTGEFNDGHIPGAYHIDHLEIGHRIKEIESFRDKPVIVYCYSGVRAGMVESYLMEHDFTQVKHLKGDWSEWKAKGLPSEN